MQTAIIWLGTRQKSAHANTAQMALSMCSSRYCSTFAPLSLFLGCRCFFGILWPFHFIFLIFFSLRSIQEVTTENLSLNQWKTWPTEFSEDVLKNEKKLSGSERQYFKLFFAKLNLPNQAKPGTHRCKIFLLINFLIKIASIGVRMQKLWLF